MKKNLILLICLLFGTIIASIAQVKISDSGSTTPGANSLLELESTTRGFLPPRMAINSLTTVAPLTGTVPAGMLVYSSGGTVTDGYYTWNGTKWLPFSTGVGAVNVVAKSATATLLKSETFVTASGNITLTLPVVTTADNGLTITVKNIGTYTDLVKVAGNSGATIDANDTARLYRWKTRTFVAYNGNWLRKEKDISADNVFEVSISGSWTTIPEIMAFLNAHMQGPSLVNLNGGQYNISATQVINLPYPVTFEGYSYGLTTIAAASGLAGTPMFNCQTESYFKMIAFDATTLTNYGNNSGEDALQLTTDATYFEIKDCTFDHFNKTINATKDVDIWLFECDIMNAIVSGVELAAGATGGITFKTSETDFTNCAKGINMNTGKNAIISVQNCNFLCGLAGQSGIVYEPATFTTPASVFITNNAWNNIGIYMSGFDFTRSDGRDANIQIGHNAGMEDKNPKCWISVVNNLTTTTCTTAGSWYKANWTNTASTTVNWTIANNRVTFQPTNRADCFMIISGNVQVNGNNRSITVAVIKKGIVTTQYGPTTVRVPTANQAFPFTTTVYLQSVAPGDYFEVYVSTVNSGDIVIVQDANIFVNAQ